MEVERLLILTNVLNDIYPKYFYFWIATLSIICIFTFTGHIEKSGDKTTHQLITETIRKRLLIAFLLVSVVFFLTMYLFAYLEFDKDINKANKYMGLLFEKLNSIELFSITSILNIITVFITPIVIVAINRRVIKPKLSALGRKFRVSQTSDTLTDVRVEHNKNKSQNFTPSTYYKTGEVFIGLDPTKTPIYMSDRDFCSTNIKILGATQMGKGVVQGVIIDQSIMKHWGTIFFDQKPDDFIYSIMCQSAMKSGRKVNVFDANEFRGISYEPFMFGNKREVISRLIKTFSLYNTGTTADFYKRKARACIRLILNSGKWDGTLKKLSELASGNHPDLSDSDNELISKYGDSIVETANELLDISSIGQSQHVLNLSSIVENGEILYIKGNLEDKTVKAICKCILIELTQTINKIIPKTHIYINVDEIRFLISSEIADSLATILSKNANMGIAYQERDDLQNIEDESINVCKSIMKSTETNTNTTLVYQSNAETAEWVAENSGTIAKSLTKLEEVDTDGFGAEKWKGRRMIGQDKEFLIPINTILTLPQRVAAFQRVGNLTKLVFTCWVEIEKHYELPVADKIIPAKKHNKLNRPKTANNDSMKDDGDYLDESELEYIKDRLSKVDVKSDIQINQPTKQAISTIEAKDVGLGKNEKPAKIIEVNTDPFGERNETNS